MSILTAGFLLVLVSITLAVIGIKQVMKLLFLWRIKMIAQAYKGWLRNGQSVLDIGCGNGVVTEELQKLFNVSITGTDIVDIRERFVFPFKFCEENRLPFADKSFNVVMFNSTLHHCKNWQEVIKEALRVADTVVVFEAKPSPLMKTYDYLVNKLIYCDGIEKGEFRTPEEWRERLKDYQVQMRNLSFFNFSFEVKKC